MCIHTPTIPVCASRRPPPHAVLNLPHASSEAFVAFLMRIRENKNATLDSRCGPSLA